MNASALTTRLVSVLAAAWLAGAAAQEGAQDTTESTQPATGSGSQEVEVSEDNYRRFMELDDRNLQRQALPPISYARPSGLERMQQLPESSQRHLRDQLRGVIMQGGRWTPADTKKEYPYVPSPAAEGDAGLRADEAAAWEELVDEYHAREAAIHANAARSRAASVASGQGEADSGQGSDAVGAASPGPRQAAAPSGSFSPEALRDAGRETGEEVRTEGVSQNALEYLTRSDGAASGAGTAAPPGSGQAQPANEQPPADAHEQSPGQASGAPAGSLASPQGSPATEQDAARVASADAQNEQAAEEVRESDSRDSDEVRFLDPETLSVEELANARGLQGAERESEEKEEEGD